jgi:hypothetical protein
LRPREYQGESFFPTLSSQFLSWKWVLLNLMEKQNQEIICTNSVA